MTLLHIVSSLTRDCHRFGGTYALFFRVEKGGNKFIRKFIYHAKLNKRKIRSCARTEKEFSYFC